MEQTQQDEQYRLKTRESSKRYYQRKINEDPTFRKQLSERVKQNKLKRNNLEKARPNGRPRIHEPIIRSSKIGRPRTVNNKEDDILLFPLKHQYENDEGYKNLSVVERFVVDMTLNGNFKEYDPYDSWKGYEHEL